jgi:hypothetical protein
MKKNDAFSYDVRRNEHITVKVVPKNFDDSMFSVKAVLDDHERDPEPGTENAPVHKFTVTKEVDDQHTLRMEFNFVAGTPENALYDVVISGENDEGCPCGFTIEKDTEDKSPNIDFVVVA